MIISNANFKGGNTKSLQVQNLSWFLAEIGYSVCVFDADSRENNSLCDWYEKRKAAGIETKFTVKKLNTNRPDEIIKAENDYQIVLVDFGGNASNKDLMRTIWKRSKLVLVPTLMLPSNFDDVVKITDELRRIGVTFKVITTTIINREFLKSWNEELSDLNIPHFATSPHIRWDSAKADGEGRVLAEILGETATKRMLDRALERVSGGLLGTKDSKMTQRHKSAQEQTELLLEIKADIEGE